MTRFRKQGEGDQDAISFACGTACPPDEDKTRQEFKDESDTNWLLRRYGVNVPQASVQYGKEVDFDVSYQDGVNAQREVLANLSQDQLQTLYQGGSAGDGSLSTAGTPSPTSASEAAEAGQVPS